MRLVLLVTEAASVRRFLRALGESTDAPARAEARGPPYWLLALTLVRDPRSCSSRSGALAIVKGSRS